MTEAPATATTLDASVLSNFAHVDRVEMLTELPRCVTVPAVQTEIEAGAETHPYLDRASSVLEETIPVVTPSRSASELEDRLLETLDPGEAQALAVAEATDGMLVTDDGDARTTAKHRAVSVTGSIGLLVRFVEDDRISPTTADDYLGRWIDEAGFRSPARNFEVFLEE